MDNIDLLRDKLYTALESGDAEEVLKASRELDAEIIKFTYCRLGRCTKEEGNSRDN